MIRKLFMVSVLLALLLSAGPGVGLADEPRPPTSPEPTPQAPPGALGGLAQEVPILPGPPGAPDVSPLVLLDIWLYVPRFSQSDPAWAGDVMQTTDPTQCTEPRTIGNKGCLLTSAAMVFKYYGAQNKNPKQLNTCMGIYACPWHWAPGANNCSESKATFNNLYSFSYSTLVWALESGRPPILYLTKPGREHWVVVHAVHGNGLSDSNYSISDPAGGQVRNLTYYTNSGWSKGTIGVYTKR